MLKLLKKLVIKEYKLDETEKLIKDIVVGMLGNENTAGTAEIYACGDMLTVGKAAQESPSFRWG